MSERDDEYRFYPEDFDGDSDPTEQEIDPAPLVIVVCLGIGIALFLGDPFVDPISVLGHSLELSLLASVVFAVGLLVGSAVYAGQRRWRLSIVHGVGALGWLLLVVGTAFSNTAVLVVGGGLLVAGAISLLVLSVRSR